MFLLARYSPKSLPSSSFNKTCRLRTSSAGSPLKQTPLTSLTLLNKFQHAPKLCKCFLHTLLYNHSNWETTVEPLSNTDFSDNQPRGPWILFIPKSVFNSVAYNITTYNFDNSAQWNPRLTELWSRFWQTTQRCLPQSLFVAFSAHT